MLLNLFHKNPFVVFVVLSEIRDNFLIFFDKIANNIFLNILNWLLGGLFWLHNCSGVATSCTVIMLI